jgi:hypothetical protein
MSVKKSARKTPDWRHERVRLDMTAAVHGIGPPQRQDSLTDQLIDLHIVATKLGMYDAADWMWKNAKLQENTMTTSRDPGC